MTYNTNNLVDLLNQYSANDLKRHMIKMNDITFINFIICYFIT